MEMQEVKRRKLGAEAEAMTATVNTSDIGKLNDDCLRNIFTFLPMVDRIKLQRVCQRWKVIAEMPWTDVRYLRQSSLFGEIGRQFLNKNWQRVRPVLKYCDRYLNLIDLTSFCFDSLADLDDCLLYIKRNCPNLKIVELSNALMNEEYYEEKSLKFHMEMYFKDCLILQKHLNYFSAKHYFVLLRDSKTKNPSSRNFPLRSLELENDFPNGEFLSGLPQIIRECQKLRVIKLKLHTTSAQRIIKIIEAVAEKETQISDMELSFTRYNEDISSEEALSHDVSAYFGKMRNLRTLRLSFGGMADDALLKAIGENCKLLAYLEIRGLKSKIRKDALREYAERSKDVRNDFQIDVKFKPRPRVAKPEIDYKHLLHNYYIANRYSP